MIAFASRHDQGVWFALEHFSTHTYYKKTQARSNKNDKLYILTLTKLSVPREVWCPRTSWDKFDGKFILNSWPAGLVQTVCLSSECLHRCCLDLIEYDFFFFRDSQRWSFFISLFGSSRILGNAVCSGSQHTTTWEMRGTVALFCIYTGPGVLRIRVERGPLPLIEMMVVQKNIFSIPQQMSSTWSLLRYEFVTRDMPIMI